MPSPQARQVPDEETGIGLPSASTFKTPLLVLVPTANSTKRMQLVLTQVQPNCFRSFERPSFQPWSTALPGVGPA